MQGASMRETMHLWHWHGLQLLCRSGAPAHDEWGVMGTYSNAVQALACMYSGIRMQADGA